MAGLKRYLQPTTMMCDEPVSDFHKTRVPKIILQRCETIPSLKKFLNVDIIKTEDDDVLDEDDSTVMIPDEYYVPSSPPTLKTESKNVNGISVENRVDVLSEEHSTGLQTDKVHVPSAFSITKAEPREVIPDSYSKTCLISPHDGSRLIKVKDEVETDIKVEEDPVQITFPTVKAECESPLNEHQLIHGEDHPYNFDMCNNAPGQNTVKNYQSIHTGGCRHACDMCDKSFSQSCTLKRHQLIHTGEHQYCCDVCNKSFSLMSTLKRHQLIHTGEHQYCCDVCNKSFSLMSTLKRHQLIHTGEHQYCCDVCNKSFSLMSTLKRHQLIHTGEHQYCCDVCNKSFRQRGNLKRHLGIHNDKSL
ncbi:zinc finger protein 679-like isoform X1 [Zootermopsis nevadensis]|nr:zinc finger protein 679-like isoform X1 [Zootermopsis nevadensis]